MIPVRCLQLIQMQQPKTIVTRTNHSSIVNILEDSLSLKSQLKFYTGILKAIVCMYL